MVEESANSMHPGDLVYRDCVSTYDPGTDERVRCPGVDEREVLVSVNPDRNKQTIVWLILASGGAICLLYDCEITVAINKVLTYVH